MEPRSAKGLGKLVRYIEVLFHTFYCNFGRTGEQLSFVIPRASLYRGSLNRGSTVVILLSQIKWNMRIYIMVEVIFLLFSQLDHILGM